VNLLCISKHNLHCILTVTAGKPVEFTQCRVHDHAASTSGSTQYVLPHEGLTAAALMCTGHQETHKDDVAVVKMGK